MGKIKIDIFNEFRTKTKVAKEKKYRALKVLDAGSVYNYDGEGNMENAGWESFCDGSLVYISPGDNILPSSKNIMYTWHSCDLLGLERLATIQKTNKAICTVPFIPDDGHFLKNAPQYEAAAEEWGKTMVLVKGRFALGGATITTEEENDDSADLFTWKDPHRDGRWVSIEPYILNFEGNAKDEHEKLVKDLTNHLTKIVAKCLAMAISKSKKLMEYDDDLADETNKVLHYAKSGEVPWTIAATYCNLIKHDYSEEVFLNNSKVFVAAMDQYHATISEVFDKIYNFSVKNLKEKIVKLNSLVNDGATKNTVLAEAVIDNFDIKTVIVNADTIYTASLQATGNFSKVTRFEMLLNTFYKLARSFDGFTGSKIENIDDMKNVLNDFREQNLVTSTEFKDILALLNNINNPKVIADMKAIGDAIVEYITELQADGYKVMVYDFIEGTGSLNIKSIATVLAKLNVKELNDFFVLLFGGDQCHKFINVLTGEKTMSAYIKEINKANVELIKGFN